MFFFLVCPFSGRLSRQRDTGFLREMPSSRYGNTTYSRCIRRNFLYTYGKIGLTLCFLLTSLFDALNEPGKLQQIRHAKGGSTSCQDHIGVRRNNAGPGCWQRPHVVSSIVKGDPIFSPIVSAGEDLKLPAVQGMEGMGDREKSFR